MTVTNKRNLNSNKPIIKSNSPGDEWAERCRYWCNKTDELIPHRKRREKQTQPLILAGHGISLKVDKGTLLVREGNTHFPAPINEFRYFPGELNIPSRIILIDGSGNITLDAIDWLAEQGVHLIRIKWNGDIISLSHPNRYAANLDNIKWQIETQNNEQRRMEFGMEIVKKKLDETKFNLINYIPASKRRDSALAHTLKTIEFLQTSQPKSISELLGMEGGVASVYFSSWNGLEMNWRELGQHPIPEEWRQFRSRSNLKLKPSNDGAMHPINAMLNYAYKVLESNMRIHCAVEGYDTRIGILHTPRRKRRPNPIIFALDLMEPYRPIIDRLIIDIAKTQKFSGADFNIQKDGVCRLNPEMARFIAQSCSEFGVIPSNTLR